MFVAVFVMVPVMINGVRLRVGVWIESVPVAVGPDVTVCVTVGVN